MWRWIACALVIGGCGLGGDDEPYDPSCHYDCFGSVRCADGVVTIVFHEPVPCEEWDEETDTCPFDTIECADGCRIDGVTEIDIDDLGDDNEGAYLLCEEHRPKQVGDPCDDPSDCLPEVATWDLEGNVTNVYLACDLGLGECVAREPPVMPDWLSPQCGIVDDDAQTEGVVFTDACGGGRCLFVEREDCVAQGCTGPCDGDGDCPPGGICFPFWGVCTPGAYGYFADNLACPPP